MIIHIMKVWKLFIRASDELVTKRLETVWKILLYVQGFPSSHSSAYKLHWEVGRIYEINNWLCVRTYMYMYRCRICISYEIYSWLIRVDAPEKLQHDIFLRDEPTNSHLTFLHRVFLCTYDAKWFRMQRYSNVIQTCREYVIEFNNILRCIYSVYVDICISCYNYIDSRRRIYVFLRNCQLWFLRYSQTVFC